MAGSLVPLPDTVVDGNKTVTSAGTAVALFGSATACKKITITAKINNAGTIVVGASTVVAAISTRRGVPLFPGDSIVLEIGDASLVFIDATVNGDGVTFTYLN